MNSCLGRFRTAILLLVTIFAVNGNADLMTLQSLIDGGELKDGRFTYSNFQVVSDVGTQSTNFVDIDVEGVGNGLEFSSSNEFFLFPGDESIVMEFSYDVSAGSLNQPRSIEQGATSFGGEPFVHGEGLVDLFVDFETLGGQQLASTNITVDPLFDIEELVDQKDFDLPVNDFRVQASLSLFSDSDTLVAFRSFQIANSVPEPGAAFLGVFLIAASTLYRRRRS